jgi:flagellar hook-length control protein FliK
MGLPTPVNFRNTQPNATAMLAAAPQKADAARDHDRFERHLDEDRPRDTQAADRHANRRAERRERDRADDRTARARNEDTKKAESDTAPQTDTDKDSIESDDAIAALMQTPADTATATKATTTDTSDQTVIADPEADAEAASATDDLPAVKADAKGVTGESASTTDTAKNAGPQTDAKPDATVAADQPKTLAPDVAAAPVVHHEQTRKAAPKADKVAQPVATTPVPASQASLVAAANGTSTNQAAGAPTEQADPDADLTITAKEGLGHEAATKMADKSDTKANAAQQTGPAAQPQTQTGPAATAASQNFAKMVASATGSEAASVTSTGSGTTPTSLSDLQNVANAPQGQNANSATVRIGTLPGQSTPTQVPAMTIALQLARNLQKGVNRFDIRLDPAEMGRIDVRMEVKKDGNVAAHMIVERPETLDLLRRDATALQQALNDAGLQADADSLNFSLRDDNGGSNGQNFSAQAQNSSGLSNFSTASDEPVLSPVYNINLSANGGIDIRV